MLRRLIYLTVLASASNLASADSDCAETASHSKLYTPECTEKYLRTADQNNDKRIDAAELRTYFGVGDWPLASVLSAGSLKGPPADAVTNILFQEAFRDDFQQNLCPEAQPDCEGPFELAGTLQVVLERNRLFKPKVIPKPVFSLSRKISDAADPRAYEDRNRPFVISYRHDRKNEAEGFQIFGTLTGPQKYLGRDDDPAWYVAPSVSFDIDTFTTTRGRNLSEIRLSAPFTHVATGSRLGGRRWLDQVITLSPTYGTDGDFGRDVLEVTANYSLSSNSFGRPGIRQPFGIGSWEWQWAPALSLYAGQINDSSGNARLEALKQSGSYVRLVPNIGTRLYTWNQALIFGFDMSYIHDEGNDIAKGYGEFSLSYDLAENVALTAYYRKGYKPTTLEEVNSILFGLGLKF